MMLKLRLALTFPVFGTGIREWQECGVHQHVTQAVVLKLTLGAPYPEKNSPEAASMY